MKKKEKKCSICKRTLVSESKSGLCPDCLNKYGTPVAAVGAGSILVAAKTVIKNKEKITKGAVKVGKTVLSLVRK